MNLHEKLFEIQKSCQYVQKNAQGYQYKYASGTDVLAPIRAKMDELKVMLFPMVTDATTERGEMVADGGKTKIQFFTQIRLNFVWVDVENPPDQIVVPFYAQGVDPGEKGVGKAWTYAERYFMLKFFHIPTDQDDPDRFQEKRAQAEAKPAKAKTKAQERPGFSTGIPMEQHQAEQAKPAQVDHGDFEDRVKSVVVDGNGTYQGKPWTRYKIETEKHGTFVTFETSVFEEARVAVTMGNPVLVHSEPTPKGNKINGFGVVEVNAVA